jgi:hypothetical protein
MPIVVGVRAVMVDEIVRCLEGMVLVVSDSHASDLGSRADGF